MSEEQKHKTKPKESSSTLIPLLGGLIIGIILGGAFFILQNQSSIEHNTQDIPAQQGEMIASLITATEIEPQNVLLWIQLGNAYYDTAQVQPAITAYTKALAINPNMPEVLIDYGTMLRAHSQFAEAREAYNKALSISQDNPVALYNQGLLLYYDMKDTAGAISAWESIVAKNPHARTPDGRLLRALIAEMKK